MTELVSFVVDRGVATVTMDDGKANALSMEMLAALHAAFDKAEAEGVGVVLAGRPGRLSAGLHLPTLRAGGSDARRMARSASDLCVRMLKFPAPVVIACTGHAMAQASFLLLCGDERIGAAGPFTISANEVAIGIVMPRSTIALCRNRLNPAELHRALVLAKVYSPKEAIAAGFLDRVVPEADVVRVATEAAVAYAAFDRKAYGATKNRLLETMLPGYTALIEKELAL